MTRLAELSEEEQAILSDRSLTRGEKQERLAAIKAEADRIRAGKATLEAQRFNRVTPMEQRVKRY